jgi:ABC-type iron transport system FetAB ATPase subunit
MILKKPMLHIRYANAADHERVTNFRIEQYKTAKEFVLIAPELLSRQSGHVYFVETEGSIISTMQVDVVHSQIQHLKFTGAKLSINLNDNFFPAFYLSKACTAKAFRNYGLNSLLRKLILMSAIKNKSIQSLTGEVFDNAPRLNVIKNLTMSS